MIDSTIPEGDLTAAESEELLLMCGHALGPEPLSPAAQAVLQAFDDARDGEYIAGEWVVNERPMLAAALRAAADHGEVVEIRTASGMFELDAVIRLSDLRAIADELEGQQ